LAISRATEAAGAFVPGALTMSRSAPCALSVDVEDYFQVWAFSSVIPRDTWDQYELRAVRSTERLLDLFDRRGAKATFFILGWVGERAPSLVRAIAERGHEVASHGYDHVKVFDQTPDEFRADLLKTKAILEEAGGAPVRGFRAAGFSIDRRTPWAHAVLRETGHSYSSSSHPIAHDHYGDPNASRAPELHGGVIEAPVAVAEVLGRRISCGGGGWFRATPYPVARRLFSHARATIGGPAIFYLHPWEIDPGQPRIKAAPMRSKLRHYVNLDVMEKKLDRLLGDFPFTRIDEALGLSAIAARP
jgi:polysaccharide deacetylase family protein (PEP-CTERM system associated)